MILPRGSHNDFREKMIVGNSIDGLLPVYIRNINNESFFYYDIHSKQSLSSLVTVRELSNEDLKMFLGCLSELQCRLGEYLLDNGKIVLDPEAIMINPQNFKPSFCYYPDKSETEEVSYLELAEVIIQNVNHEDEAATELAYGYYELVMSGQYDPGDLFERLVEIESNEAEKLFCETMNPETVWQTVEMTGEEENFYFKEASSDEPEDVTRFLLVPMCVCSAIILVAGAAYITVFLNKDILNYIGIARESYIVAGSLLAGIIAILLVAIFHFTVKKKEKQDEIKAEEERNIDKIPIVTGKMEQEEYERSSDYNKEWPDEDTVLLSEEGSGVNLGKGRRLIGNAEGQSLNIEVHKTPFVIGKLKGRADGVIDIKGISRMHARIVFEGGRYFIEDLNSTNGTYVNMRELERGERAEIETGDVIKLAGAVLTFVDT